MSPPGIGIKIETPYDGSGFDKARRDLDQFDRATDRVTRGTTSRFSSLNRTLGGLAIGSALASGVGLAASAFKDLDDGLDAVAINSGRAGSELEELEGSFRRVNRTVVSAEDAVGVAVGKLSSRLDLQGKELEALARQELNLARITKTDLGTVIDASTRLFGDFSIATSDYGKSLDSVFRLSQRTQVPFESLLRTVVQFGAPLRALGFDFQTSAALIASFEKEGVNVEAVLAGMKVGLANIAAEGKPIQETFLGVIEKIKAAKEPTDALTLGIETFGKRAGPDLVAAIREGRFDGLQPLIDDMSNAKNTINDTAAATDDYGEKWAITSKRVKENIVEFITPTLDELNSRMDATNKKLGETDQSVIDLTESGKVLRTVLFGIGDGFVWIVERAADLSVRLETEFNRVHQFLERHPLLKRLLQFAFNPAMGGAKAGFDLGLRLGGDLPKLPPGGTSRWPGMQHGGDVARRGWAMVGEAGPEFLFLPQGAQVRPLQNHQDARVLSTLVAEVLKRQANVFHINPTQQATAWEIAEEVIWKTKTSGLGVVENG